MSSAPMPQLSTQVTTAVSVIMNPPRGAATSVSPGFRIIRDKRPSAERLPVEQKTATADATGIPYLD